MPRHDLELDLAIQVLDQDLYLAEALLFPEYSRVGSSLRFVTSAIALNAKHLLAELGAREVYRRHPAAEPTLGTLELDVAPPPRSLAFSEPLSLTFHYLAWRHGDELELAYVPVLGIVVHGRTAEELEERLPQEVRAALFRMKALSSLRGLTMLQRCRELLHRRVSTSANRRTPRQQEEHENKPPTRSSTLAEVGRRLTKWSSPPAYEVDDLVDQLAEALASPGRPSVLLVGPSGVGKTAVFHEVVRRRRDLGPPLSRTTFWATSGSRVVAGQSGFGMWQERCHALCQEAQKTEAVLHLGNLMELLQVGKSEHNAQGIASFLRPYLQRGELRIVVECTDEQAALIEAENPHLLRVFHQIRVEQPSRARLLAILEGVVGVRVRRGGPVVSRGALETLERLHRRYATYSVSPGRPLRFLESLLRDRPPGAEVREADVTAAFVRETGLPDFMVDEKLALDLEATRSFISERVLGQPQAVALTVDVLATTKASLGRPGKPLASLMFVGPTGVGKTELAKVLAQFLFGDPDRLARFDMSEYTDPLAVARLTGGARSGSGEGLLTARVREEPFCVVLLDEVEKAHPLFFDLLLQVLGEARLTDAMGRVADFSSAVVIMTSNLGAEAFSRHPLGFNEGDPAQAALDTVMNAVREFYRPELINRVDRIVPFAPLDESSLVSIAAVQLERIQKREGVAFRALDLSIDEGVAGWLARRGHDPRYGARPLRRSLERDVLARVSTAVNRYGCDMALQAHVTLRDDGLAVELQAEQPKGVAPGAGPLPTSSTRLRFIIDLLERRREVGRLLSSPAAVDLRNSIFRVSRAIERSERRRDRGRPLSKEYETQRRHLARLRRVEGELDALWSEVCAREERALLGLYVDSDDDIEVAPSELDALRRATEDALLSLYGLRFEQPDQVTLAVYCQDDHALGQLTTAYFKLLRDLEATSTIWRFALERDAKTGEMKVGGRRADDKDHDAARIAGMAKGALGFAFEIRHRGALARFSGEAGVHQVVREGENEEKQELLVHCSDLVGEQYSPPEGIQRSTLTKHQKLRRAHHPALGSFTDKALNRKIRAGYWSKLHVAMGEAIDEALFTVIGEAIFR